ncbi:MAG: DUF4143 domain-containing protein [Actinomycetota bacterium]|nr:DUF4143 domain-containing protein [Actinomycetota bacterium]
MAAGEKTTGESTAGARTVFGPMKPDGYIPRLIDSRLQRMLGLFGAVEVRGTKWCGKSWSSYAVARSVAHLDDSDMRALAEADPSLALHGERPHVIDEWQEVPAVWDAVRRSVDSSGGSKGLYILTGSSTPEKDKVSHSGAGRIARLDMRTMTLFERGLAQGGVSLAGLFEGRFESGAYQGPGLGELADAICVGGWPALLGASPDDAAEVVEQYLDALFDVSIPAKGGTGQVARRLASALARNVASSATLETLAADARMDGDGGTTLARTTVRRYLDLFNDLYFIEELPGWDAPVRSRSRLRTKPKRYFTDPSMAASLLGMGPARLLEDAQTFGLLFESLCVHDLRVLASLLPGYHADSVRYYGDSDGLEVDVVLELKDGRWAAIEVKLGEAKVAKGIDNLLRLGRKVASNPASRNPEPEFMMVLTAVSPIWRRDKESGVYVVPLSALEP